jgi:superfamily II DNA helicase RecQ
VIGSMAPGSGKSLASQFPAVFLSSKSSPSFSIILSPLQSTLTTQFKILSSLDISVSISISSGTSPLEASSCLHFMTPEAFSNSRESIKKLRQSSKLVSIVIEDAHLVCNQRSSPEHIVFCQIRLWFPEVPIVALVDLRHPALISNLTNVLELRSPQIIRASLNRPNLFFSVKSLSAVSLADYLAEFYRQCQCESTVGDDGDEEEQLHLSKPSALIVTGSSKASELSSLLSSHPTLLRLGIKCSCLQTDAASNLTNFNKDVSQILIATQAFDLGRSPFLPFLSD